MKITIKSKSSSILISPLQRFWTAHPYELPQP